MTDTASLSLTLTDLECAARAWAAACSTEGAMAPEHIASALIACGDLAAAALAGSAAAEDIHRGDVARGHSGPSPRGLDLHIREGRPYALVWRTESHEVRLIDRATSVERWILRIDAPTSKSHRILAALGAAWRLREPEDHDRILAAASTAGIDLVTAEEG